MWVDKSAIVQPLLPGYEHSLRPTREESLLHGIHHPDSLGPRLNFERAKQFTGDMLWNRWIGPAKQKGTGAFLSFTEWYDQWLTESIGEQNDQNAEAIGQGSVNVQQPEVQPEVSRLIWTVCNGF